MKLRIRGDSIRLRLKQAEVSSLAAGNKLIEQTHFPGAVMSYSLGLSEKDDMEAHFIDGSLEVTLPREIIPEWADTDLVSLYSEQDLPGSGDQLKLLVEKDYSCLSPDHHRDCEDDRDTYPHPGA